MSPPSLRHFSSSPGFLSCSLEKERANQAAHLGLRGHIQTLDCHTLLKGLTCYVTSSFPLPHPALQNGEPQKCLRGRGRAVGVYQDTPGQLQSAGQWASLRCSLGLGPEVLSSHEPLNLPNTSAACSGPRASSKRNMGASIINPTRDKPQSTPVRLAGWG